MAPTRQEIDLARQTLENFLAGGDTVTAIIQPDALLVLAHDRQPLSERLIEKLLQADIIGALADVNVLDQLFIDLIALTQANVVRAFYILEEFIKDDAGLRLSSRVCEQTLLAIVKADPIHEVRVDLLTAAIMAKSDDQTFQDKREFKIVVEGLRDIAARENSHAFRALALLLPLDNFSRISDEMVVDITVRLLGNDETETVLAAVDPKGTLVKALETKANKLGEQCALAGSASNGVGVRRSYAGVPSAVPVPRTPPPHDGSRSH